MYFRKCSNTNLVRFKGTKLEAYWREFDYDDFNVEESGPRWRHYYRPVCCRFCGNWAFKYCLEWQEEKGFTFIRDVFSHHGNDDRWLQVCVGRRTFRKKGNILVSLDVSTKITPATRQACRPARSPPAPSGSPPPGLLTPQDDVGASVDEQHQEIPTPQDDADANVEQQHQEIPTPQDDDDDASVEEQHQEILEEVPAEELTRCWWGDFDTVDEAQLRIARNCEQKGLHRMPEYFLGDDAVLGRF